MCGKFFYLGRGDILSGNCGRLSQQYQTTDLNVFLDHKVHVRLRDEIKQLARRRAWSSGHRVENFGPLGLVKKHPPGSLQQP